jgi:hypothetical protein
MLRDIGDPIDVHEVNEPAMREAISIVIHHVQSRRDKQKLGRS